MTARRSERGRCHGIIKVLRRNVIFLFLFILILVQLFFIARMENKRALDKVGTGGGGTSTNLTSLPRPTAGTQATGGDKKGPRATRARDSHRDGARQKASHGKGHVPHALQKFAPWRPPRALSQGGYTKQAPGASPAAPQTRPPCLAYRAKFCGNVSLLHAWECMMNHAAQLPPACRKNLVMLAPSTILQAYNRSNNSRAFQRYNRSNNIRGFQRLRRQRPHSVHRHKYRARYRVVANLVSVRSKPHPHAGVLGHAKYGDVLLEIGPQEAHENSGTRYAHVARSAQHGSAALVGYVAHQVWQPGYSSWTPLIVPEGIMPQRWGLPTTGLCAITAYFNPTQSRWFLPNFKKFASNLERQGVPLFTAELAFGDVTVPFELTSNDSQGLVQRRTGAENVLWQKEALLNIALRNLPAPPACPFVAWLDTEVHFSSDKWVAETTSLLHRHKVVQPFEDMLMLPKGEEWVDPAGKPKTNVPGREGYRYPGIAKCIASNAQGDPKAVAKLLKKSPPCGHTGYAWAAQRRVLTKMGGLYDATPVGGGDTLISHAMWGDFYGGSIGPQPAHFEIARGWKSGKLQESASHYRRWAARAFKVVGGDITFAHGTVLHRWHAPHRSKMYGRRFGILWRAAFDPTEDIQKDGDNGVYTWTTDKTTLRSEVKAYFFSREGL